MAGHDQAGPGEATGYDPSRRRLLQAMAAGAAGLVLGGGTGAAIAQARRGASQSEATESDLVYPFTGDHQAGVLTPAQDRLHFAAFDMAPGTTRADLVDLLTTWTAAAARLTQGQAVGSGAVGTSLAAPPDDTGEALDLPPSGLTITFGFGPTLFVADDGTDRYGLARRQPAALRTLPRFAGDALEVATSGGDLAIQACANDPQVAVHAIRNLARLGFGRAGLRWSQLGFGRTSSTSTAQVTARNLHGFKDGTANLKAEDPTTADQVWVGPGDDPADWLVGGSYLVVRKIRMLIELWDRAHLGEQERVIGRDKALGAPLSGGTEFTAPDLAARGPTGALLIDERSHLRLAHPDSNGGAALLRRGYNYVDGNDALGRLDAGLFFMAYCRSPKQFITVQHSLARDRLGEYIKHTGSALFAIPAGVAEGGYVGQALFD
jgi:deferrochelatase/peroxidase EfeB